MKVKDLKEKLQRFMDDLDCYSDEQEVNTVSNTYFCSGEFIAVRDGFIPFGEPVKQEDDEDLEDF